MTQKSVTIRANVSIRAYALYGFKEPIYKKYKWVKS